MGSFSIWHWIIVLAIVILLAAFAIKLIQPGRMRSWLFRLVEGPSYSPHAIHTEDLQPRILVLPRLFQLGGLACVLGVLVAVLDSYGNGAGTDYIVAYNFAQGLIGIALILASGLVHLRPNHSRALKYTLAMSAILPNTVFTASLLMGLMVAFNELGPVYLRILLVPFALVATLIVMGVKGAAAIRRATQLGTKPGSPAEFSFAFARARVAGPLMLVCYFLSAEVLLVLFMIRYVAIERLRRSPIVYLRSFHYAGAPRAFAEGIAPAISRFGVVTGLVHGGQKSSVLLSNASIWQFGIMSTVPDDAWQGWVSGTLRYARLVIIDCSVMTESVKWEIDTALSYVSASRVLVVTNNEVPGGLDLAAKVIRYGTGRAAMRELRTEIFNWADAALGGHEARRSVRVVVAWVATLLIAALLTLWHTSVSAGLVPL